ncbi:sulfite exporter TauE/SafE family protein [Brachybacterium halotolerans subsp. kimchii]|uniref:sulfite exporter TauE/SafE family protein n=1 Tax=Brachybacterium halotolerans TaxID=2795215 RepID=UPI001E282CC6|nr:sulfite exporter TauE/SafE family protein [Brachybacterium halotolerans]UEJ84562.1 sulfite exporter TauE/SafE family protein [Brachybacterium halotolerans subsp. kimchii]
MSHLPQLGAAGWLLVVAGALVVGFSKSALPGAGTIAVGLFALALPPKESTAALLILLILGDATALWMYRREPDWRTLIRLIPSVLVGLVVGALFLKYADASAVRGGIGVILLLLVALTLWRRRRATLRARRDESRGDGTAAGEDEPTVGRIGRIGYGSLGGFTTMVANAGGPPMSMYFYAMRMPVLTFLGTSAWFFAIVNLLKLPFSASLGLFSLQYALMDVLLAPLVILSALIGRRIAQRVPQSVFEKAILVLTVVSAAALIVGA